MDSVSCKQNRRLIFSTTKINQNNISKEEVVLKNPALLAYIEGEFKILLDGEIFLEDDYMCVLELGVQLSTWLNRKDDFYYDALSSEDKSILKFISINEMEYTISSSWSKLKTFSIAKEELFEAVNSYIEHTDVLLKKHFNIKISDFM